MRLVFLGAPGAGKGTQAYRLAQHLKVPHISTGALLREMVRDDTPLAREIKSCIDSGNLIPDDKMNEAVRVRFDNRDAASGFILDGYPRTVAQARALEDYMSANSMKLDAVVFFGIPPEVAVERISGRRTCMQCGANYHLKFKPPDKENVCNSCGGELYKRDDDTPDTIKKRFEEFRRKTSDLVGFYESKDLLKEIDASPGPDEVYSQVLNSLGLEN